MKQLFLTGAALLAMATAAQAAAVTYTTTGAITGSLNGVEFTDAAVTFTVVGDTSGISFSDPVFPTYTNAGNVTINISGFSTVTYTGTDSVGVFSVDFLGAGLVGVYDLTTEAIMLGYQATTPPFYDLATNYTSTGAAVTQAGNYATSGGALSITSTGGDVTFTAEVGDVPEPASFALLGVGIAGLGLVRRRRG